MHLFVDLSLFCPDSLGGNARTVMVANIVSSNNCCIMSYFSLITQISTTSCIYALWWITFKTTVAFLLLVDSVNFDEVLVYVENWNSLRWWFWTHFLYDVFSGSCELQFWRDHHNIKVRLHYINSGGVLYRCARRQRMWILSCFGLK